MTSTRSARAPRREWLAMGAVALASALTGHDAVPPIAEALLVGGLVVATALSAPLGLAALIAAGLLSPWALPTGTQTELTLPLLLLPALLAGWLLRGVARQDWRALRARPVLALLAFGGAALLSFAVANLTPFGCGALAPVRAQLGALAGLLLPAGAFVVASTELDRRWIACLTGLFLAFGSIHVLGSYVPAIRELTDSRIPVHADGSLFWVWMAALAAGQAVGNRMLHLEWRLAFAWLVVVTLAVGLLDGRAEWLAGWLPGVVGLAALGALIVPRLTLGAAAAGGVAALVALRRLTTAAVISRNEYSLSTRFDAWLIVLGMLRRNPVFGFGPANYYHCTPLFPIRGYTVHFSSHNNYLDVMAQTGILGLGCLLWFALECARLGLRLWRRLPDGFARGYTCGCLAGLAGTLAAAALGDWWLPFVYNVTLAGLRSAVPAWIFLGGLAALARDAR